MKKLFIKDFNRRNIFLLLELERIILKYILTNFKLPLDIRLNAYINFKNVSILSTITKIKNRCVLTNRSRSVYRKFKMSRIFFKKLALDGLLIGVKKASW